ncbi:WD repeat domain-containing protein [Colletotrichum higginsianum IMI 349063]|uniref:WD repeat domain-containing protein n=2 Tax=Colletotrichum higginsianum TaxID=80884 RepID=A0A1B7YPZ6_COLHI|nr:WD repeat domain-containing protein [Colletotrichum higginsianum IMI 349063]OBR14115.1 WD repeat domain-containing protein [Colletotrichum higginsianum IMI 349063]TID01947.1 TBC1 domain family member 5 [Colletotrichum higginsianum]
MRALDDAQSRWAETLKNAGNFPELQHAVRYNGPLSPCITGLRSVCWKAFLLLQDVEPSDWSRQVSELRSFYSQRQDHFLKFIKHPEELAKVAVDPLTDDPESPWNTVRQDEIIRAEIAQDVRRLPDEPFYHEERTQTLIIDALFVYCKLHPNSGGYRQGMHELLAPIAYVINQDALDREAIAASGQPVDETMLGMLDSSFIEHDTFALFSKIMENAKSFYEVKDSISKAALASASRDRVESSAIVEKSKYIHEVCLAKVDPELANHLKDIEILPQIFLIRWIRLLFGREFPFDEMLVLWDTIFAVDPSLSLIDLICVAMLLRIRWSLLEADYSVCLQLLLKYPAPEAPHGPHTFVDDAVYLRTHLNVSGGVSLLLKYTGKMPSTTQSASSSRPTTPMGQAFSSFRNRTKGGHSPIPSASRFIQQQGGVEALFQGAAKSVLERGEKLGINQAVRDAMGDIKRNMQGLNEVRYTPRTARQLLGDDSATQAIAALEQRNRLLASMLDETVTSLRSLATSNLDDKVKTLELVEVAAAKVQFVKVYLEDPTMEVPELEGFTSPPPEESRGENSMDVEPGGEAAAEAAAAAENVAGAITTLSLADPGKTKTPPASTSPLPEPMDTAQDAPAAKPSEHPSVSVSSPIPGSHAAKSQERPQPPIPTRSTLAQSSFSWMLEPDQSPHTASPPQLPKSSSGGAHRKKPSGNISRERNAFLFGEVVADADDQAKPIKSDDIFGLQPIEKPKSPFA